MCPVWSSVPESSVRSAVCTVAQCPECVVQSAECVPVQRVWSPVWPSAQSAESVPEPRVHCPKSRVQSVPQWPDCRVHSGHWSLWTRYTGTLCTLYTAFYDPNWLVIRIIVSHWDKDLNRRRRPLIKRLFTSHSSLCSSPHIPISVH